MSQQVNTDIDSRMRALAFYLPQFHPVPENDEWWGKGFTEWTNVAKATPRFPGHEQPQLPADLGFYDLRVPDVRLAQAELARRYGIHGFCYYHYWFNGRRILERPFNDVLASGEPDFPFCICWANENWTRRWNGSDKDVLLGQDYSHEDDLDHIRSLMPAFFDSRYIRHEGKPVFLVYRASQLPDPAATCDIWREEAERHGLPGLYLIRVEGSSSENVDPRELGFDISLEFQPNYFRHWDGRTAEPKQWKRKLSRLTWRALSPLEKAMLQNRIYSFADLVRSATGPRRSNYPTLRSVCPGWDNSARVTHPAIFTGATPELYGKWLRLAIQQTSQSEDCPNFIFINAWNEWAEGAHLEPCRRWGLKWLEQTRDALAASVHELV